MSKEAEKVSALNFPTLTCFSEQSTTSRGDVGFPGADHRKCKSVKILLINLQNQYELIAVAAGGEGKSRKKYKVCDCISKNNLIFRTSAHLQIRSTAASSLTTTFSAGVGKEKKMIASPFFV